MFTNVLGLRTYTEPRTAERLVCSMCVVVGIYNGNKWNLIA